MNDITVKQHLQSVAGHLTSDQRSLVVSQQQKKDWEKVFLQSELAQEQQHDYEEQKNISFHQDEGIKKVASEIDGQELTKHDSIINSDDYLSATRKDFRGVLQCASSATNSNEIDAIRTNINDSKGVVSTTINETRVATPLLSQQTIKEPSEMKSNTHIIHNSSNLTHSKPIGKVGLHVYRTEQGELKIWMRDGSLTKQQGIAMIRELRGIFSKMGVALAKFTLNGETLFLDNQETDSLTKGEVTI